MDGAFTLSLCHGGKVLNYRIVRDEDNMLCLQEPNSEVSEDEGEKFPTLHSLLEKHKHSLVSGTLLSSLMLCNAIWRHWVLKS